MAILETIRNRGGVIITGVIGLALFSFILGDFVSPGGSSITGSKMDVAKVKRKSISFNELQSQIEELSDVVKLSNGQTSLDAASTEYIREQAFEMMVSEIIFSSEYDKLGLSVSGDELFDLVQGENPHQAVRQMFTDPQTGQFNRSALLSFLKNKNQDATGKQQMYWAFMEKQILNDQLMAKYGSLIKKGLYIPGFMNKNEIQANSKQVDFNFLVERFTSVADTAVKVAMSDLKKFYKEHPMMWNQTPTRDIEYISFDVTPSGADRRTSMDALLKLRPDFASTTNNEQFLSVNSEGSNPIRNYSLKELPVQAASLFDAAPGTIVGPYEDGSSLKLAKIVKVVSIPDSVKARHILIQPQGKTPADMAKAKDLADSLKTEIDKGANFAVLAMSHSADQGSMVKGGDLGWFKEGMMVPEFDAAAFSQATGAVTVVQSQYGYHVLEVTDRSAGNKKVEVAILEKQMAPSSETFGKVFAQASKFAATNLTGEAFTAAAKKENLNIQTANYLRENDRKVGSMATAREIVRWAFGAKLNDLSEIFTIDNAYVLAKVSTIRADEKAPLSQVKNELDGLVRTEKKAELLSKKMAEAQAGKTSLQEIAAKLRTNVESARGITFASYALPAAGVEPNVIAAATVLKPNTISNPITGTSGVYLVQVTGVTDTLRNSTAVVNRLKLDYETRAGNETFQTLRKMAKVKDLRSKFY